MNDPFWWLCSKNRSRVQRRSRARWLCWLCVTFSLGPLGGNQTSAEPVKPTNDSLVLETLRTGPVDAKTRELRALRKAHEDNPTHVEIASKLAAALIDRHRETSDPRFLSYAEAALGRWWSSTNAPVSVLVLRATIHQSLHRFQPALDDLAEAVARDPANVQAWLTRATVLQVIGDYDGAGRTLSSLAALLPGLVTTASVAHLASLTGRAAEAYQALEQAIAENPRAPLAHRAWALTALAEMAVRLGKNANAKEHFRAALALSKTDSYTLGAYADFLIDQNQAAEVVSLLREYTRIDGLLLRLAIAEETLRLPEARQHVAMLRDRFEASARRGNTVHQREEAIFALKLAKDPARALQLAENNWRVQKEPADARILLEAAIAAGKQEAAKPISDWLEKHRVGDVRLTALAAQAGFIPAP